MLMAQEAVSSMDMEQLDSVDRCVRAFMKLAQQLEKAPGFLDSDASGPGDVAAPPAESRVPLHGSGLSPCRSVSVRIWPAITTSRWRSKNTE
ncbi:hypothetical protein U9M48_011926 [Paspalum notatum var. saurae]|uniref:Uncharacterized protein n=1 Tax=Paspalum notatum var. saurae TaxID=547442 RepID=A0AAQ3SWX0_PASNO